MRSLLFVILCAFMLEVQTQMQEKMNENRLKQEVQDQAMRDAVKNHHEEKSNEAFEKALHSEQYVPYPQYPWDASQFDGHQDHILENMRNNMFLEVKENSLPFMLATQASQQDVLLSHREQLLAHNPMNLKDIDLDSVSELDSETTTEREYDLKVQEMLSSSASIRNRFGDKFNLNVRLPSSVYSEKNKQELRQGKGKNGRQNRSSGSGSGGGDGVRSQQDSNSNGRDSGAGSTSSDGNGNGIGSPTNTLEPFTDLSQIDRLLEGICFVLPSGYWSYEFCAGRSVRQYHVEQDPAQPGLGAVRTNEQNLGDFVATSSSVLREGGDNFNRAAPIVKIVQRFRGGGVCEVPAPAPTSASEAAVEVSVNTEGDAQQTPQFVAGQDSPVPLGTQPGEAGQQEQQQQQAAQPVATIIVPRETDVTLQCCVSPIDRELSGEYGHAPSASYAPLSTSSSPDITSTPPPLRHDGIAVNPRAWQQLQQLIRQESPSESLQLHNTNDPAVQPAAVVPLASSGQQGVGRSLDHHPPHGNAHFRNSNSAFDAHEGPHEGGQDRAQRFPYPESGSPLEEWGHLAGFIEPSICKYTLIACVPALCVGTDTADANAQAAAELSASPDRSQSQSESKNSKNTKKEKKKKTSKSKNNNNNNNNRKKDESNANANAKKSSPFTLPVSSLTTVLQSLSKQCLVRQEGWWTYELCFRTGIRQFHLHAETVQQAVGDGSTSTSAHMVVQNEFSLGLAPADSYTDTSTSGGGLEALVRPGSHPPGSEARGSGGASGGQESRMGLPSHVLQRAYRPRALVLEFEGGTPCDIEDIARGSTIELTCGERPGGGGRGWGAEGQPGSGSGSNGGGTGAFAGGGDQIWDIVEDRTCHYTVRVHSEELCALEGFAPLKDESGALFGQRAVAVEFVEEQRTGVWASRAKDALSVSMPIIPPMPDTGTPTHSQGEGGGLSVPDPLSVPDQALRREKQKGKKKKKEKSKKKKKKEKSKKKKKMKKEETNKKKEKETSKSNNKKKSSKSNKRSRTNTRASVI